MSSDSASDTSAASNSGLEANEKCENCANKPGTPTKSLVELAEEGVFSRLCGAVKDKNISMRYCCEIS